MFADYLSSSTDSSIRNPRPNCQRSITSSGTKQYPTSSNNLTKSACLKPGEEHQPHAGGGPLSRDSQDRRLTRSVNKKLQNFLQHLPTNPHECTQMVVTAASVCAVDFGTIGASYGAALRRRVHLWLRFLNHIPYIERGRTVSINLFHHTALDRTNLLRRPPRTHIIFSDVENDVLNKLERMSQH